MSLYTTDTQEQVAVYMRVFGAVPRDFYFGGELIMRREVEAK